MRPSAWKEYFDVRGRNYRKIMGKFSILQGYNSTRQNLSNHEKSNSTENCSSSQLMEAEIHFDKSFSRTNLWIYFSPTSNLSSCRPISHFLHFIGLILFVKNPKYTSHHYEIFPISLQDTNVWILSSAPSSKASCRIRKIRNTV
jgi:hypothetical protein